MSPLKQPGKIPVCVSRNKRPGPSRWRNTINGSQVLTEPAGPLCPAVNPGRLVEAPTPAANRENLKAKGNNRGKVRAARANLKVRRGNREKVKMARANLKGKRDGDSLFS